MSQRFCRWSLFLVCVVAVAFLAAGCSKRYVVKEEVAGRQAPVLEAKKEAPPAPVIPQVPPKMEEAKPPIPAPAPAPKVEAAPPAAPETIDLSSLRVQFAFDDYSLSKKSQQNLKTLANWMKKVPQAKIKVEGHTCDIGNNEYNLALSERRAIVAKKYLENLGISSTRISTIGYGEERPLVPNSDESHRSKNRRDEFVMAK